ncbi:MAG TPA: glutathione S-transferase family protein [Caulobacteraceae bacterium]
MKIVLHQLEISPFCDKVRRTLHFKNLDYDVRNVPLGGLASLKKLAPPGKAPILELDGKVLHDSSDICRALEAVAPEPRLIPTDPRQRAMVDILEDWADESLYFFEMTMRFTWPQDRDRWVTEILKRDNPVMRVLGRPLVPYLTKKAGIEQGIARRDEAAILRELSRHVSDIAVLLESGDGYLVGGGVTLADISVVAQLECVAGSAAGLALLREHPPVMGWLERIEAQTGGPAIR